MSDPLVWQQWHDPEDDDFILWKYGRKDSWKDSWSVNSSGEGWRIVPPLSGWKTRPDHDFVDLEVAKVWVEIEVSNGNE